jgi:formiminotetrahydrofolate cyclodeaminase
VGGGPTNRPYFKELEPVVAFSEPDIMNQFNESMDLKTTLAKKPEELSDEKRDFVRKNEGELDADQNTAFASVIDDTPAETDEEKAAREEQKGDANELLPLAALARGEGRG